MPQCLKRMEPVNIRNWLSNEPTSETTIMQVDLSSAAWEKISEYHRHKQFVLDFSRQIFYISQNDACGHLKSVVCNPTLLLIINPVLPSHC